MSMVGHFRKTCRVGLPEASVQGATIRESCSSSLVRAAHRLLALIALPSSILVCWMAWPAHAVAATWPLSASACSVDLGFQQTYTAGAKSYVHSGIDVPASAGLQIFTPLAGTVRFTGTVPSGDSRLGEQESAGATMRAVSVQIADGRTVTLMPFATVSVKAGQHVREGQVLGTLAGSGDASSTQVHLHMGLKKDGTYYDPLSLFGAASAVPTVAEKSESRAGAQKMRPEASQEAVTRSVEGVGLQQGADAPAADASALSCSTAMPEAAGVQQQEGFGAISSGDVSGVPAAQSDHVESLWEVVQEDRAPCMQQASELWGFLRDAVRAAPALPGVVAGLIAGVLFMLVAHAKGRLLGNAQPLFMREKYPLVVRRRE